MVSRADGRAESWLESVSRWWILEDGLPVPQLQVELGDGPDGIVRLDMLFPEHGVAGEADGLGKYSGPDGVEVWSARDLMPVLGYGADWRNFSAAVDRARSAAGNQGQDPDTLYGKAVP